MCVCLCFEPKRGGESESQRFIRLDAGGLDATKYLPSIIPSFLQLQAASKPAGGKAGKDREQLMASAVDSSARQSDQADRWQPTQHNVALCKQEAECVR